MDDEPEAHHDSPFLLPTPESLRGVFRHAGIAGDIAGHGHAARLAGAR
jgi:hypothetical protein